MLYWHRTDVDPEVDVAFACSTNCTFNVSVDQKENLTMKKKSF